MTRHNHADLLIEKINNMDLVVFMTVDGGQYWAEYTAPANINFLYKNQYWLCLPEYEKYCLAWLNGCKIRWYRPSQSEYGICVPYRPDLDYKTTLWGNPRYRLDIVNNNISDIIPEQNNWYKIRVIATDEIKVCMYYHNYFYSSELSSLHGVSVHDAEILGRIGDI